MEIGGVYNYSSPVVTSGNGQDLGKNDFFQILSAQLQFQDPMEGGDNSEYVAQLAQFSSLEQMENLNTAIAGLKSNQNLLFGGLMIGKTVTLSGENGIVKGEVQSVRVRGSELYVLVGEEEYPAGEILDMAGSENMQIKQIAEEIEHVGQVLDQAFAAESGLQAETILEGE